MSASWRDRRVLRTPPGQLTLVLALLAWLAAPATAPAEKHEPVWDSQEMARFVDSIVQTATEEVRKAYGFDVKGKRVNVKVYNRLTSGDRDVLRNFLGISDFDRVWTVYFFEETEPRTTGGDMTIYFRQPRAEVLGSWKWD